MAIWYTQKIELDEPLSPGQLKHFNQKMKSLDSYDWDEDAMFSDGQSARVRCPLYSLQDVGAIFTKMKIHGRFIRFLVGTNCNCMEEYGEESSCSLGSPFSCDGSSKDWIRF